VSVEWIISEAAAADGVLQMLLKMADDASLMLAAACILATLGHAGKPCKSPTPRC